MPRKDRYQTRLDADHADRVDRYADNHDLSQAEAVRRLITAGLDAEEGTATVPADEIRADLQELREEVTDDEPELVTDGSGTVMRPILEIISALYALVGFASLALLVLGVPLASSAGYVLITLASFVLSGTVSILLYTPLPDRLDRLAARQVETTMRRVT